MSGFVFRCICLTIYVSVIFIDEDTTENLVHYTLLMHNANNGEFEACTLWFNNACNECLQADVRLIFSRCLLGWSWDESSRKWVTSIWPSLSHFLSEALWRDENSAGVHRRLSHIVGTVFISFGSGQSGAGVCVSYEYAWHADSRCVACSFAPCLSFHKSLR